MICRLLEQRPALDTYCARYTRHLMLSEEEWALLRELQELLEPFKEASDYLSRDSSPLGVQITVFRALREHLEKEYEGPLEAERRQMLKILVEKFGGLEMYK